MEQSNIADQWIILFHIPKSQVEIAVHISAVLTDLLLVDITPYRRILCW